MRYLTLVRHGQAEWKEAAFADFDRPLTRRGLAEAAEMARRLRAKVRDPPDLILTSPAVRAAQTAGAFAREFAVADRLVKRIDSLYLAWPPDLAAAVRAIGTRTAHLLIVGHNPGISEFAQRLAPDARLPSFATGASCHLAFDSDHWGALGVAVAAEYDAPGRFFDLWH